MPLELKLKRHTNITNTGLQTKKEYKDFVVGALALTYTLFPSRSKPSAKRLT